MGTGIQVKAFLGQALDHACYPFVFFDATYVHGRQGQNMEVVSGAVVLAIG
jgi:transposase-like protein